VLLIRVFARVNLTLGQTEIIERKELIEQESQKEPLDQHGWMTERLAQKTRSLFYKTLLRLRLLQQRLLKGTRLKWMIFKGSRLKCGKRKEESVERTYRRALLWAVKRTIILMVWTISSASDS
jgi:hypothetical protein